MATNPENEIVPPKYEEPVEEESNGWVVASIILFTIAAIAAVFAVYFWYVFRIQMIENATNAASSADSGDGVGAAVGVFASVFLGAIFLVVVIGVAAVNFVFTGILFGVTMRKTFTSHTWRKRFYTIFDILFGLTNVLMLLTIILTFVNF